MTDSEERPLFEFAGAVADGTGVDWSAAESTATTTAAQDVLRQLQIIANLAAAHRTSPPAAQPSDRESAGTARQTWGPLSLRRKLGEGHFGTVYLALDPGLQREVALKILHDPRRAAAVIEEGRLLARVRHHNVVTVHGVDEFDGAVGLWMDFIDGRTIKEILTSRGMMGSREAAVIGVDLCRALAAVHHAGLLHRDIKAQNVMRETGGRIVLMDFGAGEIRGYTGGPRRMAGTPLYLAPEVFAGAPATIASDIYSLGVLLYYAVTMRYPVEGATTEEVEAAHADGPTPLADRRPDLPSCFVRVVERALERDPARRYRSAGEFEQALHDALQRDIALPPPIVDADSGSSRASPSVAVLLFANVGPDRDLEYFCSGLAEELVTGLGKVAGLRVASRTSSLAPRHAENPDVPGVCRELNVDAVLGGTVRKAGDRLRISVQLVRGADDSELWSETYSRRMADVFAVQEEIARSVADHMKVRLSDLARRPLITQHTGNPRAYEFYLRGRHNWGKRYQGGLQLAIEEFRKAIEEDAGYALAHAGLADAFAFLGFYSLARPRDAFARARTEAERALDIDETLPAAYTSRALVKLGDDWDFRGAEKDFLKALHLNPKDAFAQIYLSWLHVLLEEEGHAHSEAREAQKGEPDSPLINSGAGHTFFLTGRYEEAIRYCQKALDFDDKCIVAIYVMAACLAKQSRLSEAIALMEQAAELAADPAGRRPPFYLAILGNFYGRSGAKEQAEKILEELAGLTAQRVYVPPHSQAFVYAGLNDLDRAFEWQGRAYDDGASPFNYYSPVIDNMHADPRHDREWRRMERRTRGAS